MKITLSPGFTGLIKCYYKKTDQKITINTDKITRIEQQNNDTCRVLSTENLGSNHTIGYFIVEGSLDDVVAQYNRACLNQNNCTADYLTVKELGSY